MGVPVRSFVKSSTATNRMASEAAADVDGVDAQACAEIKDLHMKRSGRKRKENVRAPHTAALCSLCNSDTVDLQSWMLMQCFSVRRFRFKMSQVDMTAESSHILQDHEEKSDIMVPRPVPGVLLLISLRYTLRAPHLPPAVLVS